MRSLASVLMRQLFVQLEHLTGEGDQLRHEIKVLPFLLHSRLSLPRSFGSSWDEAFRGQAVTALSVPLYCTCFSAGLRELTERSFAAECAIGKG
jgi:hypothetical protein